MQKKITHVKAHNSGEAGKNSSYEAPPINANDVELWNDFFENNEIRRMVQDPRWNDVLTSPFSAKELGMFVWDRTISGGNVNELTFELLWNQITSALNLIHLKCAQKDQGLDDPIQILIGNGDCAQKITSEPYKKFESTKSTKSKKSNRPGQSKRPDFAGYQYVPRSNQYSKEGRAMVENRIPGDAKLFRKIRRSMLPPDGVDYNQQTKKEAVKVLTQIHDYMDRHEARYGYIVNDEELVFFRRRGTGWGHLDISPAVRHDIDGINPECKISTTKLILFYFHLVVAPNESKWKLESCRPLINLRRHLPRQAKGTVDLEGDTPVYRDESADEWD